MRVFERRVWKGSVEETMTSAGCSRVRAASAAVFMLIDVRKAFCSKLISLKKGYHKKYTTSRCVVSPGRWCVRARLSGESFPRLSRVRSLYSFPPLLLFSPIFPLPPQDLVHVYSCTTATVSVPYSCGSYSLTIIVLHLLHPNLPPIVLLKNPP